jgi:hypothetical protein
MSEKNIDEKIQEFLGQKNGKIEDIDPILSNLPIMTIDEYNGLKTTLLDVVDIIDNESSYKWDNGLYIRFSNGKDDRRFWFHIKQTQIKNFMLLFPQIRLLKLTDETRTAEYDHPFYTCCNKLYLNRYGNKPVLVHHGCMGSPPNNFYVQTFNFEKIKDLKLVDFKNDF